MPQNFQGVNKDRLRPSNSKYGGDAIHHDTLQNKNATDKDRLRPSKSKYGADVFDRETLPNKNATDKDRLRPSKSKNGADVFDRETLQNKNATAPELREMVLVAVDGSKEITKHALEWALANAVESHDKITVLAVIPAWSVRSMSVLGTLFKKGYKSVDSKDNDKEEEEYKIRETVSSMVQLMRRQIEAKKVDVKVEVISALTRGATAREAKRLCATWIVIDRHLKEEGKYCLEELESNIVIVTPSTPTILRLNLKPLSRSAESHLKEIDSSIVSPDVKLVHSTSNQGIAAMSSEAWTPLTTITLSNASMSSSEPGSPSRSSDFSSYALSETSSVWKMVLEMNSGFDTQTKAQKNNQFSDETPAHSFSNSGTSHDASPLSSPELCSANFSEQPEEHFLEKRLSTKVRLMKHASQNSLDEQIKYSDFSMVMGNNTWVSPPASPVLTPRSNLSRDLSLIHQENAPSFRKGMLRERSLSTPRLLTMKHTEIPLSQKSLPAYYPPNLFPDFVANDALQAEENEVKRASFRKSLTVLNSSYEENDKIKQSSDEARSELRLHYSTHVNPQQSLITLHDKILTRRTSLDSPPLCSICQHKSPTFGKPPKNFSFNELELATNYFSSDNFLAEGGYGSVYKGVLPNGQTVAVKQHKLASSQGAKEFCSEVEILSCAQHRNLVMLIGFCIEDSRQLLVYEFVCNGSLDAHLYGRGKPSLNWPARQKIAIGAARGLRYLHEECRVGCIVHRDMRPNNILLTHDFQPMVGDFGLARWQPDGDLGVETRVIGAFGYLAPEYIQSGQITEKADVYSFGVVLLELISGRKAIDIAQPKGQHCLTEWARPLLAKQSYSDLIDPQLKSEFCSTEISCMLQAASLCICQDPHSRPKMSQVLRVLEGDMTIAPPTSRLMCLEPSYMKSHPQEKRRFSRRFVCNNENGILAPIHHGKFSHMEEKFQ